MLTLRHAGPYLESHSVRATATSLAAGDRNAAETLRRHAAEGDFDLIVMVLGGVTRSLLDDSPVPLLLSC